MKTILVPTDFSDNANNALQYATELAESINCKLILFHNMEVQVGLQANNMITPGYAFTPAPIYPAGMAIPPEYENLYQEQLSQLTTQIQEKSGNRLTVEKYCQWGSLTENLNELILQHQVDLVVMGTQGANTFLERMIGTNTASFIQVAHSPVLVVPALAQFRKPRSIAYAADLDNDERTYLKQLNTFAQIFGADITLVHVEGKTNLNIVPDGQIINDIRNAFPDKQYRIIQLKSNDIAEGLEAFVKENSFDLLAVAMHERGFMESLFHSSISEKLAYSSTVPLLTLPQVPV